MREVLYVRSVFGIITVRYSSRAEGGISDTLSNMQLIFSDGGTRGDGKSVILRLPDFTRRYHSRFTADGVGVWHVIYTGYRHGLAFGIVL